MKNQVKILKDDSCDMLKIEVNGKCVFEQNDWDFNLTEHIRGILNELNVELVVDDYNYE